MKLSIYKKKQLLGEIFQNEVDEYKKINENISFDLNNAISSKLRLPTTGLGLGAITFAVAHHYNI